MDKKTVFFISVLMIVSLGLLQISDSSDAKSETELGYEFEVDNITYKVTETFLGSSSSEVEVYKFNGDYTEVNIPAEVNGYDVTSINYYAFADSDIVTVTIPSTVSYIENSFSECYSLQSISVDKHNQNYSSDESGVLFNKDKSELLICPLGYQGQYEIPSSVTTIHDKAFVGDRLTSVTVNEYNKYFSSDASGVLFNKDKTKLIKCPGGYIGSYVMPSGVKTIDFEAFEYCHSLVDVSISSSVENIGMEAFSGCTSITSMNIPFGVTSIGIDAFMDCTSLTHVNLPPSLKTIDQWAFERCSSLSYVIIPSSVTSIGFEAFSKCLSLESVTVDETNPNYSSDEHGVLFNKDKTELILCPGKFYGDYTIPEGVETVNNSAFMDCTSLTSATIPSSVTSLGESTFLNCTSLTSVNLPSSIKSLEWNTFYGCISLAYVKIPSSVITINGDVFNGCTSLTSIDIPSSVKTIFGFAFKDCSSLTSVTIPTSVTEIGDYVFEGCSSLTNVTIPTSVKKIGESAFDYPFYTHDRTEQISDIQGYGYIFDSDEKIFIVDSLETKFINGVNLTFEFFKYGSTLNDFEIKKDDFVSDKFYLDTECKNPIPDDYRIVEPTSLYFNWKADFPMGPGEYALLLQFDGIILGDPIVVKEGTVLPLPDKPVKNGYTVSEWSFSDGTPAVGSIMPGKDITIHCTSTPNSYSIRFDGNGSDLGTMNPMVMVYDSEFILSTNAFSKTGAAFKAWNTAPDGTGVKYSDGQRIKNLAESGEVVLYAQWTVLQYKATFVYGNGIPDSVWYFTYGTKVTAPEDPIRDGYTVTGWTPILPEQMPDATQTYTAIWTETESDLDIDSDTVILLGGFVGVILVLLFVAVNMKRHR